MTPSPGLRIGVAVALDTLREALRGRLVWLLVALAAGGFALSAFLGALTLTETRETQAALLAALLRLACAAVVAVFVVASIVREAHDKQAEMLLALPAGRGAWLLGRLAGFALLAVLAALPAALLACALAAPAQAMLWSAGLVCELWIVAVFAAFCALGLGHAAPALCATGGFYVLARSAAVLQWLAHDATQRAPDAGQRFIAAAADGVAFLLPRLDAFARAEWLLYGTGTVADLGAALAQTAIFVTLLTAACLVDLHRRRF
jgi:hypothetical protein